MAEPEKSIHDTDFSKNIFCNPAFEPDNECETKELFTVAISSEPIKPFVTRDGSVISLFVVCIREHRCRWRALVVSGAALLFLTVLAITLVLMLPYINGNQTEERMLFQNWSGDNIQQHPIQNLTVLSPEYSSPAPDLEQEPTTFKECGGVLTDSEGIISSPNYPSPYPPHSMCVWVIRLSPPYVVQLHISFLAIEGPSPCLFDWLELREKMEKTTTVSRYCGSVAPPTINTNSTTVWVSFRSDSSIGGSGFTVQYHAILPWQKICFKHEFMCDSGRCLLPVSVCDNHPNCQDQTDEANCSQKHNNCGGQMIGLSGSLTSPNHPQPYPHQQRCTWHIFAEEDQVIRLTFLNFSLETQDNCEFDYVEVHDGASAKDAIALGRYCGSALPPILTSSGPALTVVFVADEGIADSGFYLLYQVITVLQRSCSPEEFACPTGECLHQDWLCDGWNDCTDGADEQNCSSATYPSLTSSCETIRVEMCQGLSYNLTSFPNIWLSIADQREAAHMLLQYKVLMDLDCFEPLRQLVCALFVPQCRAHGGVLQPCSSVCSAAEQRCAHDLELFSLRWPFNCKLLPDSHDSVQCSLP